MRRTAMVVLTWNDLPLLATTLRTFWQFNGADITTYVVDNGSADGTAEFLRGIQRLTVIRHDRNTGVVAGAFSGWTAAAENHEFILHVENDFPSIRPVPLPRLEAYLDANPDVGFVRLNDKRDARHNIATRRPIVYEPWQDLGDGSRIAKYNYHMAFHPYLFRSCLVGPLSRPAPRTETDVMTRYEELGLRGAKLDPPCFRTLPSRQWQPGWRW